MRKQLLWIAFGVSLLFCSCATQEDIYILDHRLSALERNTQAPVRQPLDTTTLQTESLGPTDRPEAFELREQYAGLAAQQQRLQEASQLHAGRLDEIDYLVNQKLKGFEDNQLKSQERLDRLAAEMAALQSRLDAIDQLLNLEATRTQKPKPAAVAPAGPVAPKSVSEQGLYDSAKKAFDEGDLEAARKGFEKLLADFPTSSFANSAQFWIGETYYREKWYEKAILEYQKVIENYPTGNKIPAAMLKQGLSFANIGETNNARLVLQELVAKHPDSHEASVAKQKLESF